MSRLINKIFFFIDSGRIAQTRRLASLWWVCEFITFMNFSSFFWQTQKKNPNSLKQNIYFHLDVSLVMFSCMFFCVMFSCIKMMHRFISIRSINRQSPCINLHMIKWIKRFMIYDTTNFCLSCNDAFLTWFFFTVFTN